MANIFQRLFSSVTGATLPRIQPTKEMGASGVTVFGGRVQSYERSAKWTGGERYRTAAEIATNVSIVAAGTHHFLNLIAHPNWSVVPVSDEDPKAMEAAEFVEEVMYDMITSWPRIVRRAAMYRFHGFGIQEWVAKKRDDGKIGFADIEPRPQFSIEKWEIDEPTGDILGVWQRAPQSGKLLGLPRGKIVYLVDDTLTDSPEGLGIFRHLAEPYERLKTYLALETRAFERDLRGTPIGRAPLTVINRSIEQGVITQAEANVLINGMRDFVQMQVKSSNTGMLLDSMPYESQGVAGLSPGGTPQWGMELLSGSAAGLTEIASAIDRLQREMARIIGTEHLMMGDAGGNRALAVDKSRNLYLIANSVLTYIADGFRNDIISPLWDMNGFDEQYKPYLATEDVAFKDVAEVTAALRDMATAGAVLSPEDPAIDDVRDLLGISKSVPPSPEDLGLRDDEDTTSVGTETETTDAEDEEIAEGVEKARWRRQRRKSFNLNGGNIAADIEKARALRRKANGKLEGLEDPGFDPAFGRFVESGEGLVIVRH